MKKILSTLLVAVMLLTLNLETLSVWSIDALSFMTDAFSSSQQEEAETMDEFSLQVKALIGEYPTENAYSKIIIDVRENTIQRDEEKSISLERYEIDYSNTDIPVPVLPAVAVLDQMGAEARIDEESGEVVAQFSDRTEHYSFAGEAESSEKKISGDILHTEIKNGIQEIVTAGGSAKRAVGYMTEEQAEDELNLESEYDNGKFFITNPYQTRRLCVHMKNRHRLSDTYSAVKTLHDGEGFYVLQFATEDDTKNAYESLSKDRHVRSVSCDKIVTASALAEREGANLIQSDRYKKYLSDNSKNTELTVAVIDTGVDRTHPFLKKRLLKGQNFSSDGSADDVGDVHGHGSHVSGIIVDNTPSNVKILPVKALNNKGSATSLEISLAIKYAVKQGADVINMSLSGVCHDKCEMEDAIADAIKSGVTVCVAAGNDCYSTDDYCPAKIEDCITVAAAQSDGSVIANFSNFGSSVDVTAPGVDILSCKSGGGYVKMSGTSMATPFAAASAAMVLVDNPKMTPAQVEKKLKSFCVDMLVKGEDIHTGAGLLNFGKLLGDKDISPDYLSMYYWGTYTTEFFTSNLPFLCNASVNLNQTGKICTDMSMTITNSNPEVAEYDGRLITPKKSGTTKLTVSLESGYTSHLTLNLTKNDIWIDYAAKSYAGGNGTEKSPYLISTAEQLAKFAYDIRTDYHASEKCYKLTSDIDLAGKKWISAVYVNPDTAGQISLSFENDEFRGTFDGNNHIIKNMDMLDTRSVNAWKKPNYIKNIWYSRNSGFFYCIEGGTVKNLGIVDAFCPMEDAGILTHSIFQNSRVYNCFTSGFSACSGFSSAITNYDVDVKNCFSSATVLESGFAKEIYSSMSDGDVTVSNCFFSGVVLDNDCDKSRAEFVKSVESNKGYGHTKVYNCFSVNNGTIDAVFMEQNKYSSVAGCNYSGKESSINNIEATVTDVKKQSKDFFKNKSSFTDASNWNKASSWDFENTWAIDPEINNGFPYLKGMPFEYKVPFKNTGTWLDLASSSYAGGNGSKNSPYLISNAAQLAKVAHDYLFGGGENTYFKITDNIDLAGRNWRPIGSGNDLNALCNGTNYIKKKVFLGSIDGNGKTILNMNVLSSGDYVGFISIFGLGTIKNLNFENADIVGHQKAGIVCGENRIEGKIISCNVSGSVKAHSFIGGICGKNTSLAQILGCSSKTEITEIINTEPGAGFWTGEICGLNQSVIDSEVPEKIEEEPELPSTYWKAETSFAGGNGTESNPYLIATPGQLLKATTGYENNMYYRLVRDIDLKGKLWPTQGSGWYSIITTYFDGNNKTVSNLTMKNAVGLFNYCLYKGYIKNLKLINVTGSSSSGLVPMMKESQILNCSITGSLKAPIRYYGGAAMTEVGGLVNGPKSSSITGCSVNMSLSGYENVGLLASANYSEDKIYVTNCSVQGSAVGIQDGPFGNSKDFVFSNSYVSMPCSYIFVSGNYYFNKDLADGNGTPLTTEQMKDKASYKEFDFENVWEIDPNKNDGLPYLRETQNKKITYVLNGGTNVKYPETDYIPGNTVTLPKPTRKNYEFAGWYKTKDFSGSPVSVISAADKTDIILYAKWIHTYIIVFDANGGTGKMNNIPVGIGSSAKLSKCSFKRKYYLFAGWALTKDGKVKFKDAATVSNLTDKANGTVTLYAVWAPYTYTVKFKPGEHGKGKMKSQSFSYGVASALSKNTFKCKYSDKYLAGWALSEGGEIKYKPGQKVKNLTTKDKGTVTLYAVWKTNVATIKFDANGGSGKMNSIRMISNNTIHLPDNAYKAPKGEFFAGWQTKKDGGTLYFEQDNFCKTVNKNNTTITLYAKWKVTDYYIRFDANGGSGKMKNLYFAKGESKPIENRFKAPTGKHFIGWSTTRNGKVKYDGVWYVQNVTTKDSITLYACWAANTYSIKFNANGGSGSIKKQNATYGKQIKLSKNSFTEPKGKVFAGWATKSNGKPIYTNMQSVKNLTAKNKATVTLYAIWVNKGSHKITYDLNGGRLPKDAKNTYKSGTGLSLPLPTRKGYTFVGWYTKADLSGSKIKEIKPWETKDFVLYAKWKKA